MAAIMVDLERMKNPRKSITAQKRSRESQPKVENKVEDLSQKKKNQLLMSSLGYPPLPKINPDTAKVFMIGDAVFRRQYLVESRPREQKYCVGDLVWAKHKEWPWWPAMISVHPQRDEYYRYYEDGRRVSYHMQFFGPRPYHGWVEESYCQSFEGHAKFEQNKLIHLANTKRSDKMKKVKASYTIPAKQAKPFREAIVEAETAFKLGITERVHAYTYRYYSVKYQRFYE